MVDAKTKQLMDEIDKKGSLLCANNLLDEIEPYSFQAVDIFKGLLAKRGLYRYDTGMGKTVIMSGLIKARHNVNPLGKTIVFVTNAQLKQTQKDIEKWTGLEVYTSNGGKNDTGFMSTYGLEKCDVALITHSALEDFDFIIDLHKHVNIIDTIIIDEAHEICNFDESDRSLVLKAITETVDNVFSLTATPITTGKQQLPEIMVVTDPYIISNIGDLIYDMERDLAYFKEKYRYLIFDRDRISVGAKTNIEPKTIFVEPHEHQIGANGSDMFIKTKGPGAVNQYKAIEKIIRKHKEDNETGLIFAWHHIVVDGLKEYFEDLDLNIGFLTGRDSDSKCQETMNKFNNGEFDALITSKTTALNLDSDYVALFEMTTKFKQMIGRAHRGLNPKSLPVYFIFTNDTAEFSFFRRRIYTPALFIDPVIGTDFSEIYKVYKIIEYKDTIYDIEAEDRKAKFFDRLNKLKSMRDN